MRALNTYAYPLFAGALAAAMAEHFDSAAELVRRARAGGVSAFAELYEAYRGRIYALCLRMTADRSRADDLTQDTFVRAWQRLDSFRGESRFYTWLHRLGVNVVLADLRSRGRWEEREVDGEDTLEREGAAPVQNGSHAIDLERAIATLPPKARSIFVLYDVEGYRHPEIAALTGLSEGTSKAHLHRARRLLRKALNR